MNKTLISHNLGRIGEKVRLQSFTYKSDETIFEQSHEESNGSYSNIISQIYANSFFQNRNKHIKIKLQIWMEILSEYEFNSVWRTNKLNYLKLLNLMCQCEHLVHPFTSFPREGGLPFLQKHEIDRIIDEVQREVKSTKFDSKRQGDPQSQLTSVKDRKKHQYHHSSNSRPTSRREKVNSKGISQAAIKKVVLDDACESFPEDEDRHKTRTVDREGSLGLSQFVIRSSEQTIAKSKQIKSRLLNFLQGNSKTINLSTFVIIQDIPQKNSSASSKLENPRIHSHKKEVNSISDSINLEMSPVSICSKVWDYTKKKSENRKAMNQTVDLSKLMRTTVGSSKREEGRLSYPSKSIAEGQNELDFYLKGPKKQYWQSNTYTGNATPTYLNSYKHAINLSFTETDNYQTFRSQDKICCDCNYNFW